MCIVCMHVAEGLTAAACDAGDERTGRRERSPRAGSAGQGRAEQDCACHRASAVDGTVSS